MSRWRTIFSDRAILVIAALVVVVYAYPGLMSFDSFDQLDQARRWQLGDWHPPAMALLWRAVELVVAGPIGMLVLQIAALVIGCHAVLRRQLPARAAAIATLVICWFPPVITVTGVVWKDAQMAGYLLLGVGALCSPRRGVRWVGLAALVVAGAMRHNAAAATFAPMIVLWAPAWPRWRRLGVALVAWLAITAASFGLNAALATTAQHPWETSIAVTDIVGTLHYASPQTDDDLRALLAGATLHVDHDLQAAIGAHDDLRGWAFYAQIDPPIALPQTDAELAAIDRAWRTLVVREPGAYLHHRWDVFRRLLMIGAARSAPPLTTAFTTGDPDVNARVHHDATPSLVQRALFAIMRAVGGVWYAPIVYLVVALVLVGFARGAPLVQALLGSGLLYELSFLPFAPSADVRYSQWLTLTTLIALVMVVYRRATTRR